MRLATIDLGSNTVRLLVVETATASRWRSILEDQRVTRLGESLTTSGLLGDAPMARTRAVVAEYARRAAAAGATAIKIVATSAVREAANGRDFAMTIERATGQIVDVISGDEEARLTIRGIAAGLDGLGETILAFDIGGGSTEYILSRAGCVETAVSLKLGVVPLAERYPFPGRVSVDRVAAMESQVHTHLRRELPAAVLASGARELVGTAGTVTTLAALDLGLLTYDAARVHGHRMGRNAITMLRDRLYGLTEAQRAALPCLEPGRADLIVPGVVIVLASLEVTGTEGLIVSDWGLREGIMAAMIERSR